MPLTELGPDEHTERIVLREIVTGENGMAEQRRECEHHEGQTHQDGDGPPGGTIGVGRGHRDLARAELLRALHEQRHSVELGIQLSGTDLGCRVILPGNSQHG